MGILRNLDMPMLYVHAPRIPLAAAPCSQQLRARKWRSSPGLRLCDRVLECGDLGAPILSDSSLQN